MSNHIETAITIGISTEFEWLDKFIDAIYKAGKIYAHPVDQPVAWGGEIPLQRSSAGPYLRRYIQQIQTASGFADRPPMLTWFVENIGYDISIFTEPGYLQWVVYLPSNKKCKDEKCYYSDFEYYILLLLRTMKEFPILAIATDEDCYADDLDWAQKEGKWWGLKVHTPQEKENFQMLDAIIAPSLNIAILEDLVAKAAMQGYSLFPVGFEGYTTKEIIAHVADHKDGLLQWKYVCDGVTYDVTMSAMTGGFATRLFFRTLKSEDPPAIDQFAHHALILINDYIILQFVSFDSRYNYLISR